MRSQTTKKAKDPFAFLILFSSHQSLLWKWSYFWLKKKIKIFRKKISFWPKQYTLPPPSKKRLTHAFSEQLNTLLEEGEILSPTDTVIISVSGLMFFVEHSVETLKDVADVYW